MASTTIRIPLRTARRIGVLVATIALSLLQPYAARAEATAAPTKTTRKAKSTKKAAPHKEDQTVAELKAEIQRLEQRIDTLENLGQKVKVIDRKLEIQQEADATKAKEEQKAQAAAPIVTANSTGLTVTSPDKVYQFGFHGIIQGDGRFFMNGTDKGAGSTFFLNRVRPIVDGTLWNYYYFHIEPDFGQGNVVLQDGYLDTQYFKDAEFKVGKYKAPLDLERLQSDRDLIFSERALTINLVPNRDIGGSIHSDSLFDDRLTYQFALMNGVPNNTASVNTDSNDGKDFIGRVFTTPFKQSENQWLKGLGFGFGASVGDERNGTISTYKTYGQTTWFSYNSGVTAAGQRFRYEPQGYYYYRGLGLMAEFASDEHALNLTTSQKIKKGTKTITRSVSEYNNFTDRGYMLQGSYLLTGENASYGLVKPRNPFDPRRGTWGAFEIASRISNLAVDPTVFEPVNKFGNSFANPSTSAKTATEYDIGLNWYLSDNVKWQFDYPRTFFDGGAGTIAEPKDRPDESVFETQLQVTW